MYRLMIVDDEEIVRNGLAYFLDWSTFGFELVAAFEDGKEAIAYLEQETVDVVLTDIHMAEIDGLSLAKWIHEHKPHSKVVLISGYQQFDYAQRAIAYNVNHYLLKPTKYDEMTALFTKLKAELDQEYKHRSQLEVERHRFSNVLPLLHEQFIVDLVHGSFPTTESVVERAALIEFDYCLQQYPCSLLQLELSLQTDHTSVEQRQYTLINMLKNNNNYIRFYYISTSNKVITLVALSLVQEAKNLFAEKLNRQLNQLTAQMKRLFQFDLFVTSNTAYPSLIELSISAETAKVEASASTNAANHPLTYDHTELIDLLLQGELQQLIEQMDEWASRLQTYPLATIHRFYIDLFAQLTQTLIHKGLFDNDMQKKRFDYHFVIEMKALSDIKRWSNDYLTELSKFIVNQTNTNSNESTELAKSFIMENYHLDISLEDVANHVYLHPIYFSRMFKQSTGMNYIDYLTKVRIQQAITLLQSGQHKIYEIPAKVGYKNREYFTRVFKQVTGKSPRQYLVHARYKERSL